MQKFTINLSVYNQTLICTAYNISGSGLTCPSYTSCYSITSCETCVNSNDCLWCPSLGHCVPANAYSGLYPFTYIYGQCLGWSNSASGISTATSCPSECSQYQTCDACHGDAVCGWCNDPSNTGLGRCEQGGFDGPREAGTCQVMNSDGDTEEWYFELCPGELFRDVNLVFFLKYMYTYVDASV